jgi:16S rRNA G966 N2-methylase RsmD
MEGIEMIPQLITENNLLKKGGYFILEHAKETFIPKNQQLLEQRRYGHVNFSFFTTTV